MKQYLLNLGIGIDRVLNVILLGHPSDTLSQRLGRAQRVGKLKPICTSINLVAYFLVGERDHCLNSLTGKSMGKELWFWGGARSLKQVEE